MSIGSFLGATVASLVNGVFNVCSVNNGSLVGSVGNSFTTCSTGVGLVTGSLGSELITGSEAVLITGLVLYL